MGLKKNYPHYLTIRQASQKLGISKNIIYAALYSGRLPGQRNRGVWRVDVWELLRLRGKKGQVMGQILTSMLCKVVALVSNLEMLRADCEGLLRDHMQSYGFAEKFNEGDDENDQHSNS